MTIEEFVRTANDGPFRRWVHEPGMRVYLRIGFRVVDGKTMLSLEIANIEVNELERRQGRFKDVVRQIAVALLARPDADRWCIFIENTLNAHLAAYLEREGWTRRALHLGDVSPSFHAYPAAVVQR